MAVTYADCFSLMNCTLQSLKRLGFITTMYQSFSGVNNRSRSISPNSKMEKKFLLWWYAINVVSFCYCLSYFVFCMYWCYAASYGGLWLSLLIFGKFFALVFSCVSSINSNNHFVICKFLLWPLSFYFFSFQDIVFLPCSFNITATLLILVDTDWFQCPSRLWEDNPCFCPWLSFWSDWQVGFEFWSNCVVEFILCSDDYRERRLINKL